MKSFKEIYEQMISAGTPAAAQTQPQQGASTTAPGVVAPGALNPQQKQQQQKQIRDQITQKQKEIVELQKQLTSLSSKP